MHAPLKLVKNRSDIGAGTRGADMGIDAIEIAAINRGSDFFNRHPFVDVATHNESVYNKVRTSFAKRIGYVYEQCARVCDAVRTTLTDGYFPLVLSGDHSSALGTISGIKHAYPNKRLGVIWLDAHADLHSPYTSPSGNVHGMPLAAALNLDLIDNRMHEIEQETQRYWEAIKHIGTKGRKLMPQDLVYFGVRDTELPEERTMQRLGLRNYTVSEMRFRGLQSCVNEVLGRLSACDHIYVSFDVDSMEADMVSRGTGTPVSKGFSPEEIMAILQQLIATDKLACLEVCEVNPLLDLHGNKMAETAFRILEAVLPVTDPEPLSYEVSNHRTNR